MVTVMLSDTDCTSGISSVVSLMLKTSRSAKLKLSAAISIATVCILVRCCFRVA